VEEKRITIKSSEPKLNNKQLDTLLLAYTFRYLTTDNLARYRNITTNSAYSALSILHRRGYLGRKHNKSYRLQNKAARYYLTLKAVKLLGGSEYSIEDSIKKEVLVTRRYEDKKSNNFIDLQVAIMAAYMDIQDSVGDKLKILTATNMTHEQDNYLRTLPSLDVHNQDTGYHCLVDIFPDDQHLFIARKRIRKYLEHYDNQEWEWKDYPDIYLVRRSQGDRNRLKSYIEEKMDDSYLDEDDFEVFAIKEAGECLL